MRNFQMDTDTTRSQYCIAVCFPSVYSPHTKNTYITRTSNVLFAFFHILTAALLANSKCSWSILSKILSASSRPSLRFVVSCPRISHWSQMLYKAMANHQNDLGKSTKVFKSQNYMICDNISFIRLVSAYPRPTTLMLQDVSIAHFLFAVTRVK